jgi:hypothetical protein
MLLECQKDCHGPATAGEDLRLWRLFFRGEQHEISLDSPVIRHFGTLPGASPEDVNALAQAQHAEVIRGKKELEHKRAAKEDDDAMDGFSDLKLARPETGKTGGRAHGKKSQPKSL